METIVRLKKQTITKGYMMGEEGVGYTFLADGEELGVPIDHATRGVYQGYAEEVTGELAPGWHLAVSTGEELLAYLDGRDSWGFRPQECMEAGGLKIAAES